MLAAAFLELNAYSFTAPETDVVHLTLALAANQISPKDYSVWLSENSKRKARKRDGGK